ncbi:hypothetical protein PCANC_04354 [Puccinia coronata f. sp. avenae]|uniref:Uncharacterized protein n=1 Tax=Puccinia coronata f. sp. avenae TaxID=200324 RepID=A0A2N5T934_9BASI|nr:hypothetical protein PCANC_04354 [Puccinia coronata f. sp. avenae]
MSAPGAEEQHPPAHSSTPSHPSKSSQMMPGTPAIPSTPYYSVCANLAPRSHSPGCSNCPSAMTL